ncbi:hypothetical protein ECDEC14D_5048 [Escherichia coli DEC14D]|nr:hypothetical protein ECSTEC94C_5129 [Escherichia coli STEC_94C]EHX73005.1 hypothetical protein ECDEC14B_5218 [Escherichia coli DEC14B]EHX82901.1 hypothetical protein ECDEC14C_5148 [Escherichia coli DEC14C]EHX84415.1 hypothetical protein ECDEC14D_5048 [Escherichia coli DEC14D]ESD80224.1 hypothetical protein HMPREF1609_00040 [Escherichia coli 908541]
MVFYQFEIDPDACGLWITATPFGLHSLDANKTGFSLYLLLLFFH